MNRRREYVGAFPVKVAANKRVYFRAGVLLHVVPRWNVVVGTAVFRKQRLVQTHGVPAPKCALDGIIAR